MNAHVSDGRKRERERERERESERGGGGDLGGREPKNKWAKENKKRESHKDILRGKEWKEGESKWCVACVYAHFMKDNNNNNNIFYLYSAFPTPKVTLQVRLKKQRQIDLNTRRHKIPDYGGRTRTGSHNYDILNKLHRERILLHNIILYLFIWQTVISGMKHRYSLLQNKPLEHTVR